MNRSNIHFHWWEESTLTNAPTLAAMGFVKVRVSIENIADPSRSEGVEMIVDTGAIHPVVPRDLLARLGIEPTDEKEFILASGERVRYPVGEARVVIGGEKAPALVIFGAEGAHPLLGVIVLESLGLKVDPGKGELQRTELLLLRAGRVEADDSNGPMSSP